MKEFVLNLLQDSHILHWSKLKTFADGKQILTLGVGSVSDKIENAVGKGENGNEQFFSVHVLTLSQTSPGFYVSAAQVF